MKICYFKTLSQLLLIPFLLIFLLIGCLPGEKTIPKTTYYTLAYDPPKFQDPKPLPDIIRVERFQAAPIYNSDRIVYSEDQFQREEYFYHKWRTKPVELVTYFLVRDMQASSLFKAVTNRNSKISPSYSVEGTVDDFFEKDQEKLWEAVLSVSIILLKENEQRISKKVLLQKKYSARSRCAKRNPQSLAEAMSRAMAQISEMIITDIHQTIVNVSTSKD